MIRFVDIRGQGIGLRFAFWNTIVDCFIDIDGDFAWNNWDEFAEFADKTADLDRYRSLCPDWVFDGCKDDTEGWYLQPDNQLDKPTRSEFLAYVAKWVKDNPDKIKSHIEAIECLNFTPSKKK